MFINLHMFINFGVLVHFNKNSLVCITMSKVYIC